MARPSSYSQTRKKEPKSLWFHTLAACLFILALCAAVVAAVNQFGSVDDALTVQSVPLSQRPSAVSSQSLNGQNSNLPDLLNEKTAPDGNPTEKIAQLDALGNPITDNTNGGGLAGGNDIPPKPITIKNGQPQNRSAMIKALTKNSPFGPIPTIASDGRKAVSSYARSANITPGTKPVSIIIGGLGINRTLTRRAMTDLPRDVTLSFAAHALDLQNQVNDARERGFEVMIELPMESSAFDASEPGADRALRVTGPNIKTTNMRNLDWLMSRASGYFAVTNYNGDAFLARSDALVPVLTRLSSSGLGFIFDGSSQAPSLPTLASASALPFTKAYTLLDENPDTASINERLAVLAAHAKTGNTNGDAAIGVGFTYPQTLDAVAAFTNGMSAQGLSLVPASSTLKTRQ